MAKACDMQQMPKKPAALKILVIRNDNIGDLVCTLPLLDGLHQLHPEARICVLATTYNRPVLDRHPAVDRIVTYTKQAHRGSTRAVVAGALHKAALIARLAEQRFDIAIAAATPVSGRTRNLLRWIAPRRAVFADESQRGHEVERVWALGHELGLTGEPPAARIFPDVLRTRHIRGILDKHVRGARVAIHISSRKRSQQWPASLFVELIRSLATERPDLGFVLLWAPGATEGGAHPGDDEKAREILEGTRGCRLCPVPTPTLEDTIATLAACDAFIGSDGGAMHIAAAVGLPAVCFFGDSSSKQWHPWKTPHVLLQPASREAADIAPATVARALNELLPVKDPQAAARVSSACAM